MRNRPFLSTVGTNVVDMTIIAVHARDIDLDCIDDDVCCVCSVNTDVLSAEKKLNSYH